MIILQDCDASVLIKPTFVMAHVLRASALKNLGQIEEVIDAYKKILEFDPDCLEARKEVSKEIDNSR